MDLQVLISTMHQTTNSLIEFMNIQSDAIIINQCDNNSYDLLKIKNKEIIFISLAERGVGLSRNTALHRSVSNICVMADDDMIFTDEYEDIVLNTFKMYPDADVILFDIPIHYNNGEIRHTVKRKGRVRLYNSMRYGTVNISFRRESILKKRISFSLLFGGGAVYGSGEDTLFLIDCIKNGLKVYSHPEIIANIYERESTWFKGYNSKFFRDKGALFTSINKRLSLFLIIQFAIRRRNLYIKDMSLKDAIYHMIEGKKLFYTK